MALDKPPQTVEDALDWGYTHLEFTCKRKRCQHVGHVPLAPFNVVLGFRRMTLWDVFSRCKCSRCGLRPITGSLAIAREINGEKGFYAKRVDFYEGMTLRPSRE
ncbi:hypothetical protein ACETRX_02955 [Labrys portucalensis]|uniref:Uncharacterized protein n=1 Tax=Labrys neptuniae TaxID=376174 RepID=A0ABV6Z8P2_9HYPH